MQIKPFFEYIKQFIELTPVEEDYILAKVKIKKYLKGQLVVKNGEVCRHENFVLSGCLKTFYIDNDGHEHVVMFAIENWWTADLGSFITQTAADLNVQCIENSELIQIHHNDLQQLYLEIPTLERFFRIIIQKAFVAAQKRIVNNFSLPAMELYLQFREHYSQIEQRVPQYMIASYLGMTKEFLSKIRNQLMAQRGE